MVEIEKLSRALQERNAHNPTKIESVIWSKRNQFLIRLYACNTKGDEEGLIGLSINSFVV